jgi:hypothetical protein
VFKKNIISTVLEARDVEALCTKLLLYACGLCAYKEERKKEKAKKRLSKDWQKLV